MKVTKQITLSQSNHTDGKKTGDDVFFIHTGHQKVPLHRKSTDPVIEIAELMMLQGYV